MNAIAKKLFIKPGKRWLVYNTPPGYLALLEPLPEGTQIYFEPNGHFDGIQLFVKNNDELIQSMQVIAPLVTTDTIFWITYPKKSSGIKSDLEMMGNWNEMARYNLRVVAAASINETWTAIRFRPEGLSKVSESRNDNIRQNDYSAFIDVDNKEILLPPNVKEALEQRLDAMAFYQTLSYSNKKEYVVWILSAKQEKTRTERLVKMIEKLSTGKRNPAEK